MVYLLLLGQPAYKEQPFMPDAGEKSIPGKLILSI